MGARSGPVPERTERAIASRDAGQDDGYCNACFTGRYPLAVGDAQAKLSFEGVLA